MSGLRAAMSFLTRIPVGGDIRSEADVARGVPWFPVVGGVVGLASGGVYALASTSLPPLLAASLAVAAGIAVTGAFHEDGLADTFDALGSRRGPDDALRIMREPTLGTFGVLALLVSLLVRVASVASFDGTVALVVLPAAHAIGRASAVRFLTRRPAASDGLGASYASAVTGPQLVVATASGIAIGAAALGAAVVPVGAAALAVSGMLAAIAMRRVGGVTGDILGAAEQGAEVAVLLVAVALAHHGWAPAPWWS